MDDSIIFFMVVLYIAYSAIKEKLEDGKRRRKHPSPQPQRMPETATQSGQSARQSEPAGNIEFRIPRIEGAPPEDSYPASMQEPAQPPESVEWEELPELGYEEVERQTACEEAVPVTTETEPAPQPVVAAGAPHPMLQPKNAMAAVIYAEILSRPKAYRRRRR